mgnify:CR=1 FL=1|jgi:spore coat protein U-like protein
MIRTCPPLAALLLALAFVVWPSKAEANVNCRIDTMAINFGASASGTGSVSFTCTSFNGSSGPVTICSQLGTPSFPGTTQQPKMIGTKGGLLDFNLYTNAARTTIWVGSNRLTTSVTIPANGTVSGTMPFYGLIPGGQAAAADSYSAFIHNTSLGALVSGVCATNTSAIFGGFNGQDGTVNVNATVSSACTVSAGNLAFGTVSASATNLAGSSTLTVTCPKGTPYYIGLVPSNGSTTGAGTMSGSAGNTDKPAYQLRSTPGSSGTIWGNTATPTSAGNGVAGTGSGGPQTHTVHATMPGANYRPDSYSDTVTVRVHY